MLILSVGVSTVQYASYIRDSRLIYGNRLIVVSRGTYFAEALPIGSILSNTTVNLLSNTAGVGSAVPILSVLSLRGLVPVNVTLAVPMGEWASVFENLRLQPGGRLPEHNDEIVVGSTVAFSSQLTQGSSLRITTQFTSQVYGVSGILYGSPSPILDHAILMLLPEAQRIYGYQGLISMIAITPTPGTNQTNLQARVTNTLSVVTVLTEEERESAGEPLVQQFLTWGNWVELVSFVLSMIFVATLSLINVNERKRELATARALGASRFSLFELYLLENAYAGLIGGAIGLIFGILLSVSNSTNFTHAPILLSLTDIPNIVPLWSAAITLLFTVGISALTGGLIFLASSKQDIAGTLRYEF